MNKEEQIKVGFRELYDKMSWLNRRKMEDSLKGYTSSEVHCMEYIEKNKDSNVTKLADSFYMTRGAISKLTKKLIKKELIESYQKSDNKKEIYFRLTEKGRAVYDIHEKLHNEFSERDKVVFEQVTEEQFNSMLHFVELYSQHLDKEIKKVTLNTKSE
ncbi:MarR family winged helix-turn-helix transcriptional regulator [Carnobacterium maltaromaticum]|jgi:DNA-binding MarR family transcriptional regulator|uniref:MarR family protein n=2 Tax=Carnobacterium maltaromaticum TaxID=2751 RepID=K8ELA3_CARML|nr:MarR family transcriptional regulator [Carnobacterium maltaromaticum]AOA03235.1 MarR family transcriptional regulator [Carnobacterium maltaromaticum]KRN60511.1 MarR family transcriptional regulator [Carnobacterium maltaromaticum DSM 20342]MCI1818728.1 MarR family transcriptional regulator [Carnobacterium maltaromaticum]MDZ5759395.1 MarR family transcriptional regulator [Carnobacterium maltaromaticum]CCO12678.2 marR family protein [Carnobacterium maltaromaticum LMA28]